MKKYELKLYAENGQVKAVNPLALSEANKGKVTLLTVNASLENISFDAFRAAEIFLSEENADFCALQLFCNYWCQPCFGSDFKNVPNRTQALLTERNGVYKFILAMCSTEYKTFLEGGDNGLKCVMYSQKNGLNNIDGQVALISAEGSDPKEIIRACLSTALEITVGEIRMREERYYPPVLDYLGWCTWDALHIHVSENGILKKIREFKEKNIPVKYVIIDDMWADCTNLNDIPLDTNFDNMVYTMHRSSMNDFVADKRRFPKGLAHSVKLIHAENLLVGVWYPLQGYWYGVNEGGALYEKLKDCFITLSDGRIVVAPEYEKAKKVYDYFNCYLKECGVDFIKVDCQASYERYYKEIATIGNAAQNLQRAVEDSANEFFAGNVINCMGMATECIFNRKKTAVSRVSNDFMPENAEWFSKHILQCAYNSLIYGEIYVGDWDMWWTDDGQAAKNSLLRAISGGPVYVSDRIDRSNRNVIMPLVTDDGKILKADGACVPVKECLTSDARTSGKPFAVYNRADSSVLLAVFNIDAADKPVSGRIDLKQFGFNENVIVYDYFANSRANVDKDGLIDIRLGGSNEYKYYVITPVSEDRMCAEKPEKFVFVKNRD